MALATPSDLIRYNFDVEAVAPYLERAGSRIRRYLSGRTSAVGLFADPAVTHPDLPELVCAIANRMAKTSSNVVRGISSEAVDNGSVTWGAQAYQGTSSLTDAEKRDLDKLYPALPYSVDIL